MKAILKIESGELSKFNGHTFEIEKIAGNRVHISFDGFRIERLLFSEVLIVNLDTELRVIESKISDINVGVVPTDLNLFLADLQALRKNLQRYCIANGYEFNVL